MRLKLSRRMTATLVALASPVVAFAAAPEATTELVFDLMDAPRHERRLRDFKEAVARMNREQRDALDRIEIKEQMVADLIAGRRSFDDVVGQFLAMSAGRPMALTMLLSDQPEATDEERAAYSVLTYVSTRGVPVGYALPKLALEYETRFGRPYPRK